MTNESDEKYLPVARLIELLSTLDPNYRVSPNRVGNLLIMNDDNEYLGFVDFLLEGAVELD